MTSQEIRELARREESTPPGLSLQVVTQSYFLPLIGTTLAGAVNGPVTFAVFGAGMVIGRLGAQATNG